MLKRKPVWAILLSPLILPFSHVYASDALKNKKAEKVTATVTHSWNMPKDTAMTVPHTAGYWRARIAQMKEDLDEPEAEFMNKLAQNAVECISDEDGDHLLDKNGLSICDVSRELIHFDNDKKTPHDKECKHTTKETLVLEFKDLNVTYIESTVKTHHANGKVETDAPDIHADFDGDVVGKLRPQ